MDSTTRSRATGAAAPGPGAVIGVMDWLADDSPRDREPVFPFDDTDEYPPPGLVAPPTAVFCFDDTAEHPAPVLKPQGPRSLKPAPVPHRSLVWRAMGWSGRMARRTVAVAVLLLVLWFWAVPFCLPVTSRAVVNAQTVQVRAPIPGQITALAVRVGDPITAGESVLRVTGRNVDASHLSLVRSKHAELTARRARLDAELACTTAAETACRKDLERYTRAMVDQLGAARVEGQARVDVAKLESVAADRRVDRARDLSIRGVGGRSDQDDALDFAAAAKARIDLERAGVGRTEKELAAAGQGLFVTRDAPFFQLQARELALKVTHLRADLAETDELLKAARQALKEEEERVRGMSEAPVPAPASGVVWKRPGGLSQMVDKNEAVLDVADQQSVFVEALLHQRYLNSVAPGCRATICLTGGATLAGRVRAVRTPNSAEAELGYAVSLTDGDPRQLKVVIALDGTAPDAALIGQHARVLITGTEPGPVGGAVEWLFTRLRF